MRSQKWLTRNPNPNPTTTHQIYADTTSSPERSEWRTYTTSPEIKSALRSEASFGRSRPALLGTATKVLEGRQDVRRDAHRLWAVVTALWKLAMGLILDDHR